MPDSAAFTVLKAATIASSIGLFASPLPDLLRIHRSKAIGEVSVVPLVSMCGCGFLWVLYGVLMSSIFPVAVTNILGILASGSYISVYLYYTPAKRYVATLLAWVALGLGCVTLYAVLGASGVTGQSNKQVGKIVGFVAVGVNIVLYGSPFETIAKVVRTKSASSLPIALCFVAMLNCALWVLYGIIDGDMFVLTPNVIGLAFSIVQVALYVKYRPGKRHQTQANGTEDVQLSGVVVELSPKGENGNGFAFTKLKSPIIEPMRSPLAPVPEHHA